MSTIGKIPELPLNQSYLTFERQTQLTSYQFKIRNASEKINSFAQPNKNLQKLKVEEIGIQDDIEFLQQEVENLQVDNPDSSQEMETVDTNLSSSKDVKMKNEFLKSVHKTDETMILAIEKVIKFG